MCRASHDRKPLITVYDGKAGTLFTSEGSVYTRLAQLVA